MLHSQRDTIKNKILQKLTLSLHALNGKQRLLCVLIVAICLLTAIFGEQGRVLLPEEYCRRLGLDGEVVLIGSHSRVEIWNPERWAAATADEDEVFRRVAGEVGL